MNLANYFENVLENLKNDNQLPFVKTEVVYDTFLYPDVLLELIKHKLNNPKTELTYVTKEFPINKTDLYIKEDGYVSIDYIVLNETDKKLYLVELKTTDKSLDYEQLRRYGIAIGEFETILVKYLNRRYANKTDYEKQRDDVKKLLEGKKDWDVELIYILPGDGTYSDVHERVKKVIDRKQKSLDNQEKVGKLSEEEKSKRKERIEYFKGIEESINGKIHTISLNALIKGKSEKDFAENSILDQFLYIWFKTKSK